MADHGFWTCAQRDPSKLALVEPEGHTLDARRAARQCNRSSTGCARSASRKATASRRARQRRRDLGDLLAAQQAGWYITPINWHLTAPEIAYILVGLRRQGGHRARARRRAVRAACDEIGFPTRGRFAVGDCRASARSRSHRGPADLAAGRTHRRRVDEVHVGHHRPAEGREARARAAESTRHGHADDGGVLACSASSPGRQRASVRLAALSHRGAHFASNHLHLGHSRGADGQVGRRGDARADRALPRHLEPHGADAVQPPAQAARGRPREVRRLVAAPHDPRRGALPGRHQAADDRLVGHRLRVLRGVRGRRHARDAAGVAEEAGHRRPAMAERRDPDLRRRGNHVPAGQPGTVWIRWATPKFEYHGDEKKTRRTGS